MGEIDLTASTYGSYNGSVAPWGNAGNGYGESTVLKFHIDIDNIESVGGITVGSTDVLHLWDIPIGTEIRKVLCVLRTAPTATTCTVNCGDSEQAAGWMSAFTLAAAGDLHGSDITTDNYPIIGGRLYLAANILHMTFAAAVPAGAVFDLYVYATLVDY
jgi:hypothetical protein